MLRSRLLCKTTPDGPRDALTASHKLLCRASFFKLGSASGFWETLPLGKMVLDKLEAIVAEEMLAIEGCQQVDLPCVMGSESWERTGRWNKGGEMFCLEDRKKKQLLLAPTHEEAVVEMVTGMYNVVPSSLLPLCVFQIGKKYRDELRPRAGLLRAREFVMKDMYSFDESVDKALDTYERVCLAYQKVFAERLGIRNVLKAQAVSGDMGGNYSHEFHFESKAGEDTVLKCSLGGGFCANVEAASPQTKPGSRCTCEKCACQGRGEIVEAKCIEVGHSFFLGTRYSLPLKARSIPSGQTQPQFLQMGCYGLGITRILAAVVETSHDEDGIVWPPSIAPFSLVVVPSPAATQESVTTLLLQCNRQHVLVDDRPTASTSCLSASWAAWTRSACLTSLIR
ncbi:hypothetical protein BASA81_006914 [Batrachochytrium salamandrivorans]|nr:hypothetical protein BASA81_006914 [Batrachochytrium salamandrivorans]